MADVAREAANDVIDRLRALGVHREGTIHIQTVPTWISRAGFAAEQATLEVAPTPWCGPMWFNDRTTTRS